MKNFFRNLFLAALFMGGFSLEATHIMGGEITWSCTPSGQYIFRMKLYRDCQGISAPSSAILRAFNYPTTGGQATFPMSRVSQTDISPDCNVPNSPGATELSCFNFGGSQGNGDGAVEESVYQTAPVTLNGTPPANGWVFTWSSCCRNNTVDNINSPGGTGHTLRAIMYPFTPPGGTGPRNANPCYDNSPVFEENANTVICTGYPFTYNHNATDAELDSLFYSWADPLDDGSGWNPPASPPTVNWLSGYSSTSPLPGTAQNPSNVPASIDGPTGQISYTSYTQGSYVTCIKVEAWKCGQLVAEIFRDIQVTLINCGAVNNPPTLLITPAPGSVPINVNGTIITATAFAGDLVAFSLNATDFDFQPQSFAPQEIEFSATGNNLAPIGNPGGGCLNPPCANITPTPGQPTFVNPTNNQVEFSWNTDCNHLNTQNGCGTFRNSYSFALRMEDDFCPAPAISIATLKVTVVADPSDPPQMGCVGYDPSGGINVTWTAPVDTGFRFDKYIIYFKPANTPGAVFSAVDSNSNYAATSALLNGLPNNGDGEYFMRVRGMCGYLSVPSDTSGIIVMNLTTSAPPVSSAMLDWNRIGSGTTYEVWAESPPGAGNWTMIGTTTDTSYQVLASFCNAPVSFQIRIPLGVGGTCGSTVDSAIFFDNVNDDIMIIDSASVGAGGLAELSWQDSPSGDVIEYYVLQMDPATLLFNVVDTVPIGTAMPWINLNSNATTTPEVYKVVSIDSCGNQSDDVQVIRHKTMFLKNYLDKCTATNSLTWTRYEGFTANLYNVMVQVTDPAGNQNPPVLLNSQPSNDSTYIHSGLLNGYTYCYFIRAMDTVNNVSAVSNRICFQADVPNKSKLMYLADVSVQNSSIELFTFIDGTADVVSYDIERSDTPVGPFISLGRVLKPTGAPYIIEYSDFSADFTGKKYWYRVSALDSCGARDTVTNVSRNILLQVNNEKGLSNRLVWNPYTEFAGEVGSYTVWRSDNETYGFTEIATVPGTDTVYMDFFSTEADPDNGRFCYYVEANEINNPLNFVGLDGQPFKSRSNVDCDVVKARIFLPTAFRPGSDNPDNALFGPSAVFETSAYKFLVMNRWGEVVFNTTNPDKKWDGVSSSGMLAPAGVYMYLIIYESLEDVPVEQRGHFNLIR